MLFRSQATYPAAGPATPFNARSPRRDGPPSPPNPAVDSTSTPPRPPQFSAQSGPILGRSATRPRAHSTPKIAASIERRDIVAALLDYPSLLADPDVIAACVHLEGPAALTVAALRKAYTGEKGLDTAEFLAQIPPAIQSFAEGRLAVPEHETESKAKEALLASAMRLERLILALDIVEITRDLRKDADLGKLRDAQERAERANGIKGINANARAARTSTLGATPHEERPFEEAADEDGRGFQQAPAAWPGAGESGEGEPEGDPEG